MTEKAEHAKAILHRYEDNLVVLNEIDRVEEVRAAEDVTT